MSRNSATGVYPCAPHRTLHQGTVDCAAWVAGCTMRACCDFPDACRVRACRRCHAAALLLAAGRTSTRPSSLCASSPRLRAHPPPPSHSPSLRRSLRRSAHGRLLTRRQSRLRSWTGERGHACTRAAARWLTWLAALCRLGHLVLLWSRIAPTVHAPTSAPFQLAEHRKGVRSGGWSEQLHSAMRRCTAAR